MCVTVFGVRVARARRERKHHCVTERGPMARTVVLIVLLDTLPDFPKILNETLANRYKLEPTTNNIDQCGPTIVNSVFNKTRPGSVESNDLEENINDLKDSVTGGDNNELTFQDYTPEQYNFYSFENADFISVYDTPRGIIKNNTHAQNPENFPTIATVSVEESAPFLVAIFETLSNITAQTCAGTLLSSNWVVTAASCVNVLGNSYRNNKSNSIEKSSYTIVAGSTNPLADGSVHNVTDIIFPDPLEVTQMVDHKKDPNSVVKIRNSSLVLMKIEPGLTAGGIKTFENEIREGVEVIVHGWTLLKNDSLEVMQSTSTLARVAAVSTCHIASACGQCLVLSGGSINAQVGSGGPVTARSGRGARLLGVLLDERAPMLAEPLSPSSWVHRALVNNKT